MWLRELKHDSSWSARRRSFQSSMIDDINDAARAPNILCQWQPLHLTVGWSSLFCLFFQDLPPNPKRGFS